eukprot:379580_1
MSPSFLCAIQSSPKSLKINIERTPNGRRSIPLARTFLNWILLTDLSHDYNTRTKPNTNRTKRRIIIRNIIQYIYIWFNILQCLVQYQQLFPSQNNITFLVQKKIIQKYKLQYLIQYNIKYLLILHGINLVKFIYSDSPQFICSNGTAALLTYGHNISNCSGTTQSTP